MNSIAVDLGELERETLRLTERYVREVVVALDLCPWALTSLTRGSVQISVNTDYFDRDNLADAARVCARMLARARTDIELVLLVLPRLGVRRLDMDVLLATLREEMTEHEGVATFALAAFHPDAHPDTASGERFIPFLRRSPDPLVQAIRFTALERIDDKHAGGTTFLDAAALDPSVWSTPSTPSLRSRIARKNLQHVLELGIDEVATRLDDICEDRRRTHLRLGLTP